MAPANWRSRGSPKCSINVATSCIRSVTRLHIVEWPQKNHTTHSCHLGRCCTWLWLGNRLVVVTCGSDISCPSCLFLHVQVLLQYLHSRNNMMPRLASSITSLLSTHSFLFIVRYRKYSFWGFISWSIFLLGAIMNNADLTCVFSPYFAGPGGIFVVMLMRKFGRLPVLFWSQVS